MTVPFVKQNRGDNSPVPPSVPTRPTYAIWVRDLGWLRHDAPSGDIFATEEREVANAVRAFYGEGALVSPFDESMPSLEKVFLQREHEHKEKTLLRRVWRRLNCHGSRPNGR